MKWYFVVFFLFLTWQQLFSQPNEEFRSTWVIDFQWLQPGNSAEANKALIREVLDNHKRANMTSVLWQVRRWGSVYYPSAIEPWGPQTNFQNPGFDPLEYAVEQAHERGLEFHAWFNTFESRHQYSGSPSNLYPEWICRDQNNIVMPPELAWLSPGLPEMREYLVSVAMEIVNNYDVDGLHMDFVRWSEHTNDGKSLALAKQNLENNLPDGFITRAQEEALLKNQAGRYLYDPQHPLSGGIPDGAGTWEDWWRGSVTEFVHVLHDSIQAVKPWVRLSPAALGRYNWGGWQGYNIVYQDAALWLNEGFIDQLVGMHYHWSNPGDIYDVLEGGCPNCWSQFIQPGIAAGRLYSVGLFSDSFSGNGVFHRHESIIDTVRTVEWADGFQFFSYGSWENQRYWDVAASSFFNSKAKIRATGLFDDVAPAAPALAVTRIDSLHYQISITPTSSAPENPWFAIYRSEDDVLDVHADEIIETQFKIDQFSYTDSFDGLQDFNGTYYYFATQLDRYWNESDVSNSVQSDPIPSLAPVILETSPLEGDTIPVSSNIKITFSKTMEANSVQAALSLEPAATIGQFVWADDQKSVIIQISGNLEFATEYSLTVSAAAADINGKSLDGNNDGSAGGDFVHLVYHPGPGQCWSWIISSFPEIESMEENFTIDEMITFVFDELIDNTSVTDERIILQSDGVDIPFDFIQTDLTDYSVITIQPNDPFENNRDYQVILAKEISDTLGNQMPEDISNSFRTSSERYTEITIIEKFTFPGDWWQPDASGSTIGIFTTGTSFGFTSQTVPPASRPKKAAFLNYTWDTTAGDWLLREYLGGGTPRNVEFDSTWVLQCYVFGDGSNTQFRFAIDDNVPQAGAENHEVSQWIPIDWVGWRLTEWQLSDPNSVGEWLGNGILEGTLRFDSYQLRYEPGVSAASGRIFFDDLRLVKKSSDPVSITNSGQLIPEKFQLCQNFPNPFNPSTTIAFDLPENSSVKLIVYDMLGREAAVLLDERKTAGHYKVQFDAAALASGVYIYRLSSNQKTVSKRMLLLK